MTSAPVAVAVAVAVVLLGSGAVAAKVTWSELGDERSRWAALPDAEAARAPARRQRLSPGAFEFFAARLTRGDRYYVHTPQGDSVQLADEGTIVRTYAAYALLPAVQVASPAEATVVVAYDADPAALDLDYSSLERFRGGVDASVARVAR